MEPTALEREFKFYLDHQEEFVEKYPGKIIVIKDQVVQGVYDETSRAYFDSITKFEEGTFLIQKCTPGDESYTWRYPPFRMKF